MFRRVDPHDTRVLDFDSEPAAQSTDQAMFGSADVTAQSRWVSRRSESELARLFAAGTATHIPTESNRQQPLVGPNRGPGLSPLVMELLDQLADAAHDRQMGGETP